MLTNPVYLSLGWVKESGIPESECCISKQKILLILTYICLAHSVIKHDEKCRLILKICIVFIEEFGVRIVFGMYLNIRTSHHLQYFSLSDNPHHINFFSDLLYIPTHAPFTL
jgi:hypothetical protein